MHVGVCVTVGRCHYVSDTIAIPNTVFIYVRLSLNGKIIIVCDLCTY